MSIVDALFRATRNVRSFLAYGSAIDAEAPNDLENMETVEQQLSRRVEIQKALEEMRRQEGIMKR